MGLEMLERGGLEEFLEFHRDIHPRRKDAEGLFRWYCMENPFLRSRDNPKVVLFRKGREIVGESVINPFPWHYSGESRMGYMNYDYHVMEGSRGAAGVGLAMKTFSIKPYFGVGYSPEAERVWKGLGARPIGSVRMFIWLRNPLKAVVMMRPGCGESASGMGPPGVIREGGHEFRLTRELSGWKEQSWKDTLEFSRPRKLLEWRFLKSPRRYHLYLEGKGKSYFVVRNGFYKGHPFLVLVDYRVPQDDGKVFRNMLKVCKKIARGCGFEGVVTGSSHRLFDRALRRSLFVRAGKSDALIMTNAGVDLPEEAIRKRVFVLATMADSDVDLVRF